MANGASQRLVLAVPSFHQIRKDQAMCFFCKPVRFFCKLEDGCGWQSIVANDDCWRGSFVEKSIALARRFDILKCGICVDLSTPQRGGRSENARYCRGSMNLLCTTGHLSRSTDAFLNFVGRHVFQAIAGMRAQPFRGPSRLTGQWMPSHGSPDRLMGRLHVKSNSVNPPVGPGGPIGIPRMGFT